MKIEDKEILMDYIKNELCSKSVDCLSVASLEKIADILCLDVKDIIKKD